MYARRHNKGAYSAPDTCFGTMCYGTVWDGAHRGWGAMYVIANDVLGSEVCWTLGGCRCWTVLHIHSIDEQLILPLSGP